MHAVGQWHSTFEHAGAIFLTECSKTQNIDSVNALKVKTTQK